MPGDIQVKKEQSNWGSFEEKKFDQCRGENEKKGGRMWTHHKISWTLAGEKRRAVGRRTNTYRGEKKRKGWEKIQGWRRKIRGSVLILIPA